MIETKNISMIAEIALQVDEDIDKFKGIVGIIPAFQSFPLYIESQKQISILRFKLERGQLPKHYLSVLSSLAETLDKSYYDIVPRRAA